MNRGKCQPQPPQCVARCPSSLPPGQTPPPPFHSQTCERCNQWFMRQFSGGVVAAAAGRTEAFVPLCESAYARRQINEQITHNTMQWQWKRRAAVTCDLSEKFAVGCEILKQCYRLTQPPPAGVQREPGNTEGATLKRTASPQRIMYVRPQPLPLPFLCPRHFTLPAGGISLSALLTLPPSLTRLSVIQTFNPKGIINK